MPEYSVGIEHLRVGVFIRLGLRWFEHPFLSNSFKIKSAQQIRILKDLGLSEVFYVPEKSERQPAPPASCVREKAVDRPPPLEADLAQERLWALKKERIRRLRERNQRISRCEKDYKRSFALVARTMHRLVAGFPDAGQDADELIAGMVDNLLSEREVVLHLLNVKAVDDGVFYHTLNVAILSLLLAKECGLEARAMRDLGLGAIFHDIGKSRIPKKLLYKRVPLTQPERDLLRLHPKYGQEMASKIQDLPESSLDVISQHHETLDGCGYPAGLSGNNISKLSMIVATANTYDNYCNRIDPSDSLTPHEALSLMFGRHRSELGEDLVAVFIRCLGIYPPGTVVQLSDDRPGIVVSTNPKDQLRPSILVYDPEIPHSEALILNLDEESDLSIVESIRPSRLLPEVHSYLNPHARAIYSFDSPASST